MTTPSPDDRLRSVLEDAVSDVEPRDRLAAIHARTASSSPRRPWLLVAAGAVAATAATVTAVTVLGDGGTSQEPGFAGPSTSSAPSPSPTPSTSPLPSPSPDSGPTEPGPAGLVPGAVYYLGATEAGPRLFPEVHLDREAANDVQAAVETAVAGRPYDPEYYTGWPAGTEVLTAGVEDTGGAPRIVVVLRNDTTDLRTRPAGTTVEEAEIAVQQLVYSAQSVTYTQLPVQLLFARGTGREEPTETLLGVPVSEPLTPGDPTEVLARVWITNQTEGSEVTSPFEVSGFASAFEANVLWEVWDVSGADRLVDSGFTTAQECCTMAPYSFTVDVPPGVYVVVARDESPETGEARFVDSKTITVLP